MRRRWKVLAWIGGTLGGVAVASPLWIPLVADAAEPWIRRELLAIADDVDPQLFLIADRHQRRGLLRLGKPGFGDTPQRLRAHARRQAGFQPLAIDQPIGLWVASNDRRRQYGVVEQGPILSFSGWSNICLVFYLIQVETSVGE